MRAGSRKKGREERKKKSGEDRGCFNLRVDVLVGLLTSQPLEIPVVSVRAWIFEAGNALLRSRGQFIACTRKSAGKNAKRVVNNRGRDAMIEHLFDTARRHFSLSLSFSLLPVN